MRVPNEKQVPIIRIEGEFPAELDVYDFVEFGLLGLNPKEGSNLVWRFVQYYEDGTKEEFTGPIGSRYPSPVVTLKAAQTSTN